MRSLNNLLNNHYNSQYNCELYSINCAAHTINNIVQDILGFLCYSPKNEKQILNVLNNDNFEISEEEEILFLPDTRKGLLFKNIF